MTSAQRLLRRRVQARIARIEPELRNALLAVFDDLAKSIKPSEIEAMIRSGALDDLLSDAMLDDVLAPFRATHQAIMGEATRLMARDVPGMSASTIGVFNVLSPRVIQAIRVLDTKVVRTLKEGIRKAVRDHVEAGLREGIAPKAIARGLREVIGMAPNQAEAVRNFRRMLETGDTEALTRKLRDHRFDRTLRKALGKDGTGLSTAQIDRMTDAYRRRMIAWNAETNARTAAIDALKQGQQLSWANAVDRGFVDGARLRKKWITVGDSKVRPEHQAMEGEGEDGSIPWDGQYSNGDTVPGENEFNCRCRSQMFQVREEP